MLRLRDEKLCQGANSSAIERATWGGKTQELQRQFQRLIGVPVESFDSYPDLNLLQNLGSAIRHGDGHAARTVYNICPTLWFNWLAPGTEIKAGNFHLAIPNDGPTHPSFESITLTEALLDQMILSVQWFWEDLELMRCNSFKQKNHTVVEKLTRWPTERDDRVGKRHWSPNEQPNTIAQGSE
jgi:hypothetical protein